MPSPLQRLRLVAFAGSLCLPAGFGFAQANTSPNSAAHYTIGQLPLVATLANNTSQAWYDIRPKAGRSYCVTATTAQFETAQPR